MITEFIAWLDDSEESISELHYNLPALNAKFLLIVTDSTYDLDVDGLPDDASEQMIATLNCLAKAQAVEA
jgi:hypothetical protein